jgi:hypothetical protein
MDKLDELIHRIKQHQPLIIIIFIYLLAIILLI